jgi:hypothetical protein
MAEFTMCINHACPLSANCKRHAVTGTRPEPVGQAYATCEPEQDGTCKDQLPVPLEEIGQ